MSWLFSFIFDGFSLPESPVAVQQLVMELPQSEVAFAVPLPPIWKTAGIRLSRDSAYQRFWVLF